MTKPPLVEVTWTDARDDSTDGLRYPSDEIRLRINLRYGRTTRGLLVHQDEEKTILAHDFDLPEKNDDDQRPEVGNFTVIPTGWVTRVRYIERGPRKAKKDGHGTGESEKAS